MATIEAPTGIEQITAVEPFFIPLENLPSQLVLDEVAGLDEIAIRSANAKEALTTISFEEYSKNVGALGSDRLSEDQRSQVYTVQGLLEDAARHSDALSTIRAGGEKLAVTVRQKMAEEISHAKIKKQCFKMLNGHAYWLEFDSNGNMQLCGEDERVGGVFFGVLTHPNKVDGREAQPNDYVQLITDVMAEASLAWGEGLEAARQSAARCVGQIAVAPRFSRV